MYGGAMSPWGRSRRTVIYEVHCTVYFLLVVYLWFKNYLKTEALKNSPDSCIPRYRYPQSIKLIDLFITL